MCRALSNIPFAEELILLFNLDWSILNFYILVKGVLIDVLMMY